jgi:hypothetical protein
MTEFNSTARFKQAVTPADSRLNEQGINAPLNQAIWVPQEREILLGI